MELETKRKDSTNQAKLNHKGLHTPSNLKYVQINERTIMNEITLLCKENKEELLRKLTYAAEAAQEATDEEDMERWFNSIENIMYVLRNCDYQDKEHEIDDIEEYLRNKARN